MQEIDAVEHRRAAFDPAGRLGNQTHDRVTRDRFPRAGFADDPEGLAAFDAETHAIDGAIDAAARVEIGAKIGDVQQRHERAEAECASECGNEIFADDSPGDATQRGSSTFWSSRALGQQLGKQSLVPSHHFLQREPGSGHPRGPWSQRMRSPVRLRERGSAMRLGQHRRLGGIAIR